MIQSAFRARAAKRAAAEERKKRTQVPPMFREVYSDRGQKARILAVATLTDPAQVIGCPLIPDMAMHAAQEEGYGPSGRSQARGPGPGERHDPFKDLTRAPADFSSGQPRQAAPASGGREGRLRRPVQVERGEQVHQDRLSKFGDRLRDMEDMANSIGLELSASRGVMGTLETQEKRWEEQERARMERGEIFD